MATYKQKVPNSLNTLCQDYFGDILTMSYVDGCLAMMRSNDILAKWCDTKNLYSIADGYEVINSVLKPNQTMIVFDNDGISDCSDTGVIGDIIGKKPTELLDKSYAKSLFMFVKYPLKSSAGQVIDDSLNTIKITTSNIYLYPDVNDPDAVYKSDELDMPLYTFYSHMTNPTSNNVANMLNYIKVTNTTTENVEIHGLVLFFSSLSIGCSTC